MAGKYLGETLIKVEDSPYKDYTPFDWAMYFIEAYGQIDGSHHKDWVMDQVARIHKGTGVIIKLAKWDCGQEYYRINLEEATDEYHNWVKEMKGYSKDENGNYFIRDEDDLYIYDEGIAP